MYKTVHVMHQINVIYDITRYSII